MMEDEDRRTTETLQWGLSYASKKCIVRSSTGGISPCYLLEKRTGVLESVRPFPPFLVPSELMTGG
jgi:hypothetical protein